MASETVELEELEKRMSTAAALRTGEPRPGLSPVRIRADAADVPTAGTAGDVKSATTEDE